MEISYSIKKTNSDPITLTCDENQYNYVKQFNTFATNFSYGRHLHRKVELIGVFIWSESGMKGRGIYLARVRHEGMGYLFGQSQP